MKIAIIGTREASLEVQNRVYGEIVEYLTNKGVKLSEIDLVQSGNAEGIDQVANRFIDNNVTVVHYLPWNSYNYNLRVEKANYIVMGDDNSFNDEIVELFPWVFQKSPGFVRLIKRDMSIIKGVDTVFWYTGKGVTGGTAYGIKYARYLGIECVELKGEIK